MSLQISYRIIDNILKHPDADNLEIAVIGGWHCIVRKDEFKAGDSGVFFQEGLTLPDLPEFEFMKANKFKIKSKKIRGILSQGLFMKPEILVSYPMLDSILKDRHIGDSLEDLFYNIKKTEYEANAEDKDGNSFPDYIPKTGLERIQNLMSSAHFYFSLSNIDFIVTEKLDGQSMTIVYDAEKDEFLVCSKNRSYTIDQNSRFVVNAKDLGLLDKIKKFIEHYGLQHIAFQGELCGPGIQANRLKFSEKEFFLYNMYDCNERKSIPYSAPCWVNMTSLFGIKIVPFIFDYNNPIKILEQFDNVQNVIQFADRKSLINSDCNAEGLVFIQDSNPDNKFKVISNNYLLKNNL